MISTELYSTVVVMSLLTTLIGPPVLGLLYRRRSMPAHERGERPDFAVQDGRLPDL